jgi:hypothetical protein
MVVGGCTGFHRPMSRPVTAEFVKESTRYYIDVITQPYDGRFQLQPTGFDRIYRFQLVRIRDPVWTFEREGERVYFTRCEFRSIEDDITLELDIWLVPFGDKMRVIDLKTHKVNGESWFTYERYDVTLLEEKPA